MNYWIVFAVLIAIYIAFSIFAKHLAKYKNFVNAVFVIAILASYLYVVIYMYYDVGIDDWNFKNTLPTANVSPFMFCLSSIILIMPKAIRKHLFTLVALLSLAMAMAGLGGAIGYVMRDYAFHWHIALDCAAHVFISLWGVYLVKSSQVELTRKSAFRGGAIIVCVAGLMLVHNLIFDTAFFGLSLSGKHNIYNNVFFESGIVSALVYFLGLCGLLCLGYYYQKVLDFRKEK